LNKKFAQNICDVLGKEIYANKTYHLEGKQQFNLDVSNLKMEFILLYLKANSKAKCNNSLKLNSHE
tara:strand:+ start:171 stop:368 length:198 start_codon:yes stop_codon:yes gene_type:complete